MFENDAGLELYHSPGSWIVGPDSPSYMMELGAMWIFNNKVTNNKIGSSTSDSHCPGLAESWEWEDEDPFLRISREVTQGELSNYY